MRSALPYEDEVLTEQQPNSFQNSHGGQPIVSVRNVIRRFGRDAAVDGVSLNVHEGEIVGVIGRSGAGKSTLIRMINGLERPDEGEVFVEGRNIADLPEGELRPLRRRIGMVFQHFNLLTAKTVEENIALPLKLAGVDRAVRLKRAHELLDLVGLEEKARAYPASLSGGQKQRVGIARALAANPALLLSDEATSALDPETTRSILDLLRQINRELGLTILLITHEMEVIREIASRVAVLDRGRIIEQGEVWKVFADPQTEITRSLLAGIRPQLPPELAARLSEAGDGPLVFSVDLAGADAPPAFLNGLFATAPQALQLVHGGLDHIQGQPVGRFFFAYTSDNGLAPEIVAYLNAHNARTEVLGHVSHPV